MRHWRGLLLGAFTTLVAVFLIVPTLVVVPLSFTESQVLLWPPRGFTGHWYEELLNNPGWRDGVVHSLQVAAVTVVTATVLGTMTALGLERARPRRAVRAAVGGLVFSPAIVPVIVLAIGVYFVFVDLGLTATVGGLVIAHTVLALPFVVITVQASLGSVDRRLEDAASTMGAGPFRTFFAVTLPLMAPGVLAGALFAFITSWDEIVMAIFLTAPTFQTLPVVMFTQVQDYVDPTVVAAATLQFAVTTLGLLAVAVVMSWRDRRLRRVAR